MCKICINNKNKLLNGSVILILFLEINTNNKIE